MSGSCEIVDSCVSCLTGLFPEDFLRETAVETGFVARIRHQSKSVTGRSIR